jgi:hypothetical protein
MVKVVLTEEEVWDEIDLFLSSLYCSDMITEKQFLHINMKIELVK